MKVSIIIPSYGQAQFLSEAIESALSQTYEDVEVIVVDDGSTDGSLDIARSYGPQVKVIATTNRGLASARNTGIMNATGEWILPLDADDILREKAVERIVEYARETDADIIGLSVRCFGKYDQDVILIPDPTLEDFKIGNRLAYCSAIKRSALLECGGYSAKMDVLGGWEDLSLWYDLLLRGKKIVTIPEILMFYRTKENSMWVETTKKEKNNKLWDQIIKDFPPKKDHAKDA
jgi:glycosyltransferase involved in cell wall biosynthesis